MSSREAPLPITLLALPEETIIASMLGTIWQPCECVPPLTCMPGMPFELSQGINLSLRCGRGYYDLQVASQLPLRRAVELLLSLPVAATIYFHQD